MPKSNERRGRREAAGGGREVGGGTMSGRGDGGRIGRERTQESRVLDGVWRIGGRIKARWVSGFFWKNGQYQNIFPANSGCKKKPGKGVPGPVKPAKTAPPKTRRTGLRAMLNTARALVEGMGLECRVPGLDVDPIAVGSPKGQSKSIKKSLPNFTDQTWRTWIRWSGESRAKYSDWQDKFSSLEAPTKEMGQGGQCDECEDEDTATPVEPNTLLIEGSYMAGSKEGNAIERTVALCQGGTYAPPTAEEYRAVWEAPTYAARMRTIGREAIINDHSKDQ
ncbi:hypothetical protein DFH07DRAFT_765306 [Mycena maculata]|uniref:Uncharacterized protein n=1 Tax=Mycena maculata TaxID=230809 RepID=A0AAD7NYW1_9AGAR|nr:hypothetical protein DFH07DRAFT_765306 [Mycena maculata]